MPLKQGLRLPLLVAGLLGAIYLLLVQERLDLPNRAASALWDLAHLPLFFLLTLTFDQATQRRHRPPLAVWLQLLLPPLLIFAFGTEWLQSLTDRQPSWLDVLSNCAGIALAALWLGSRRYGGRATRQLASVCLVLVATALLWRPAWLWYADHESALRFPGLASFENGVELENWSLGRRADSHAVDGRYALEVALPEQRFAGTTLRHFPSDWSPYERFRLSVFNPAAAALPLSLRIHDRQHELTGQRYHDRFNYNFTAAPGWTHIQLPLTRIASSPRDRRLDLHAVTAVRVFYQGTPPAGTTFYLDAVALSQQSSSTDAGQSQALE